MPIPKPHSLQPTVLGFASLPKILVVDDGVVKAPESVAGSRGSNLGVGEDVLDARPALRPVPGLLLLRGLRKEDCQKFVHIAGRQRPGCHLAEQRCSIREHFVDDLLHVRELSLREILRNVSAVLDRKDGFPALHRKVKRILANDANRRKSDRHGARAVMLIGQEGKRSTASSSAMTICSANLASTHTLSP